MFGIADFRNGAWAPAGFFPGVDKLELGLGTKVLQGARFIKGWSPSGGLGAETPEADDRL